MQRPSPAIRFGLALVAACLLAQTAGARGRKRPPAPPVYLEECGSCHLAYPARMLPARSWDAVLAGLDAHFGVDATVEAPSLAELRAYLAGAARSRESAADAAPPLRISETRWFREEHGARLWRRRSVAPADCGACHRRADQGSYAERDIVLPEPRQPEQEGTQ